MIVHISGALRARTAAHGPGAGARATLPHKPTHEPSVQNRGRVVAGGGSWLDGAHFPETTFGLEIVFGPEHHFGARKGSPPPHARSAKPLWNPPSACPRPEGSHRARARHGIGPPFFSRAWCYPLLDEGQNCGPRGFWVRWCGVAAPVARSSGARGGPGV